MKIVRFKVAIVSVILILTICTPSVLADKSEGDLNTFCPHMCISMYNTMLKSLLELNDAQASLFQVSSDGIKDGNLYYSNVLQDTFFIFGGTTEEFGTATTAYIHCSLNDSSQLKNIPMLIWAANIQNAYFGKIEETGSSFLEWVNGVKEDGDTFNSSYFVASYNEVPLDSCSLLLMKH